MDWNEWDKLHKETLRQKKIQEDIKNEERRMKTIVRTHLKEALPTARLSTADADMVLNALEGYRNQKREEKRTLLTHLVIKQRELIQIQSIKAEKKLQERLAVQAKERAMKAEKVMSVFMYPIVEAQIPYSGELCVLLFLQSNIPCLTVILIALHCP
jgi:hypothetical protein